MSIKYKIDDAKKNKNLTNDEIKLSRVKTKGAPGSDDGKNQEAPIRLLYLNFLIKLII